MIFGNAFDFPAFWAKDLCTSLQSRLGQSSPLCNLCKECKIRRHSFNLLIRSNFALSAFIPGTSDCPLPEEGFDRPPHSSWSCDDTRIASWRAFLTGLHAGFVCPSQRSFERLLQATAAFKSWNSYLEPKYMQKISSWQKRHQKMKLNGNKALSFPSLPTCEHCLRTSTSQAKSDSLRHFLKRRSERYPAGFLSHQERHIRGTPECLLSLHCTSSAFYLAFMVLTACRKTTL